MLVGLGGMVFGFALLWVVLQLPSTGSAGMSAATGLLLFVAAFAIGPEAVVFVLIAELYPQQIRGLGTASAAARDALPAQDLDMTVQTITSSWTHI